MVQYSPNFELPRRRWLAGAAITALSATAHGQERLDTDTTGFPLDDAARALLGWWTTPAGIVRGYVGGAGAQMHLRLAQPTRPSRRPVVLLHDAGQSGRVWDRAIALMGQTRAALAPDLPAHGDSDGDPLTPVEGHAAAVLRLIDRMSIGTFDLVGEGLGGETAALIAALAPGRVGQAIVMAAPAGPTFSTPRPDPTDRENTNFLASDWAAFRNTYAADAPFGVIDRDFADLLRSTAAAPRNRGVASILAGASLPDGVRMRPAGPRGEATINADAWVKTILADLDSTPTGNVSGPVMWPDEAPPRGAIVRRFMSTPGAQMHYRIAAGDGAGPPLLCFHMSPRSGAYYESLMAALAVAGRTVIAVDSAGYGESFKPPAWLNVPGYAKHMADFTDALGADQVDVMGDHTGAKVAIETVRQRPKIVRRVVMNTAGVYSLEEQRGWQQRMESIPVRDDGGHYAALWTRYHTLNRGKLDSEQNAFRFYETVRAGPCMWWGPRAANLYILGDVLPAIEHPILLICSDEDSLIAPTRRGAALLKNGRYVEFAKQGNSMVEYRAAAIAPTIAAHLA